ncbi:MAG: transcriptional regulator of heat shock response [Oceanicoccus sp.]|jgi:transcriptional regulator of heat shock response
MDNERKIQILGKVIEHFIETAQPVGSKTIILTYDFKVSPATVRNDMAALEKEGLIMQPHTSAGRVPTDKGYRLYVDQLADFAQAKTRAHDTLNLLRNQEEEHQVKQKVQEAVNLLNRATPNVAFATIPANDSTFFMGFSKLLRQPEFMDAPMQASQVMEVIEDGQQFLRGLRNLETGPHTQILIGPENIIHGIESCSMIVTEYEVEGFRGHMGILGSKRMPYAFNSALVTEVRDLLESNQL